MLGTTAAHSSCWTPTPFFLGNEKIAAGSPRAREREIWRRCIHRPHSIKRKRALSRLSLFLSVAATRNTSPNRAEDDGRLQCSSQLPHSLDVLSQSTYLFLPQSTGVFLLENMPSSSRLSHLASSQHSPLPDAGIPTMKTAPKHPPSSSGARTSDGYGSGRSPPATILLLHEVCLLVDCFN